MPVVGTIPHLAQGIQDSVPGLPRRSARLAHGRFRSQGCENGPGGTGEGLCPKRPLMFRAQDLTCSVRQRLRTYSSPTYRSCLQPLAGCPETGDLRTPFSSFLWGAHRFFPGRAGAGRCRSVSVPRQRTRTSLAAQKASGDHNGSRILPRHTGPITRWQKSSPAGQGDAAKRVDRGPRRAIPVFTHDAGPGTRTGDAMVRRQPRTGTRPLTYAETFPLTPHQETNRQKCVTPGRGNVKILTEPCRAPADTRPLSARWSRPHG